MAGRSLPAASAAVLIPFYSEYLNRPGLSYLHCLTIRVIFLVMIFGQQALCQNTFVLRINSNHYRTTWSEASFRDYIIFEGLRESSRVSRWRELDWRWLQQQ